ncbi:hypothetical protein KPP03845_105848 [Streptomyces xanthophaeus]|nr:hypothetical protein KPP03845_105848 [Streptomyces xanthophaeus]
MDICREITELFSNDELDIVLGAAMMAETI